MSAVAPVRVKICGVTAPDHALTAADAGADFIGLMFAQESRRYLTPEHAKEIVDELRAAFPASTGPKLAGVFVNEPLDVIARLVDDLGLDIVQLSGDEPWSMLPKLPRPCFKAFRVAAGTSLDEAIAGLEEGRTALEGTASYFLLDAAVAGSYGGTGQRADWSIAAELARRFPVVLAGGLSPDNVTEAVAQVRPWGVDVSSGVETGGVKDIEKIRAFVLAAKGATVRP